MIAFGKNLSTKKFAQLYSDSQYHSAEKWIIRNETCTGSSSLKSVPQFARPRISWHKWWVAIVMQRLKVQVFRKVLYIYKIRSSRFETSRCIWSKHFKWWLQEIALQSFRLQYVFRAHPCVFQTFRLKVLAKSFHCLFGSKVWTKHSIDPLKKWIPRKHIQFASVKKDTNHSSAGLLLTSLTFTYNLLAVLLKKTRQKISNRLHLNSVWKRLQNVRKKNNSISAGLTCRTFRSGTIQKFRNNHYDYRSLIKYHFVVANFVVLFKLELPCTLNSKSVMHQALLGFRFYNSEIQVRNFRNIL